MRIKKTYLLSIDTFSKLTKRDVQDITLATFILSFQIFFIFLIGLVWVNKGFDLSMVAFLLPSIYTSYLTSKCIYNTLDNRK